MNDSEKQLVAALTSDAAAVLQKNAELTDQVIPSLQKRAELAETTLDGFKKQAADRDSKLRSVIEKVADVWVDRGILKSANKASLVDMVVNDPAQGIEALDKIASSSSAVQLGSADTEKTASDSLDPIERFALS